MADQRMRILQIIQKPQLRGAEIFACQLSEELIDRGLQVDVLCLFAHTHFALNFKVKFMQLEANIGRRYLDIKAYKKLSSIIIQGKYDIVQANAADTLKYAAMSKTLYHWKAKLIYRNANLMGRFLRTPLQRAYNKWLLSKCDKIISVSENCRQDLIDFFPPAQDCAITIPIGTYNFEEIEAYHREGVGDEPVFIHIGGFVKEKNHEFLLKIFNHYFSLHRKGYLWLVGEGKLKTDIEEKTRQLGLESRVVFWGARTDVISLLKSADIMLMPSTIEGLPAVILEALSCGIAVVASNVGGIPEVIHHGINGFCLVYFDEKEYVECMQALLNEDALYAKFADAGKRLVKDTLHMKLIASQFHNYYTRSMQTTFPKHI